MNERTMTEQKEQRNWLVLRTFNRRERDVSDFLKEKGLPHFIPMRYKEKATPDGRLQRVLVPVVHNYLFVEEQMPVQEMKSLMAECRYPLHFLSRRDDKQPYVISEREMLEFRMLCDPSFEAKITVNTEGEDVPVGKEVEVIHGQFAGMRGRLIRKQKQYWFIKTIAGISVQLRITRWYCKPL